MAVSGVGGEERGKDEGEEGEGDQELRVWEAVKSVDSSTRYTAALPHVTYTNIQTTKCTHYVSSKEKLDVNVVSMSKPIERKH